MDERLQTNVFTVVDSAIKRQLVIQIKLDTIWRTVEPYQLGVHKGTQASVVYGYCRDLIPTGLTETRWQVFELEGIKAIELTNYSFQPHSDYEGRCEFMQTVYRRLIPLWKDVKMGCLAVRTAGYAIERIRLSKRLGNQNGLA